MNTEFKVIKFVPADKLKTSYIKDDKMHLVYNVVAFENGEFSNPITVKIYKTDNTCYLCFWLQNKEIIATGSDKCTSIFYIGGALSTALKSAGIEFNNSFGGNGEVSINQALNSIMKYMGYSEFTVIRS